VFSWTEERSSKMGSLADRVLPGPARLPNKILCRGKKSWLGQPSRTLGAKAEVPREKAPSPYSVSAISIAFTSA